MKSANEEVRSQTLLGPEDRPPVGQAAQPCVSVSAACSGDQGAGKRSSADRLVPTLRLPLAFFFLPEFDAEGKPFLPKHKEKQAS